MKQIMKNHYIITGYHKEKKERYLVRAIIGKITKEQAEKILDNFIRNPTECQQEIHKLYTDFQIEIVDENDCWWNW